MIKRYGEFEHLMRVQEEKYHVLPRAVVWARLAEVPPSVYPSKSVREVSKGLEEFTHRQVNMIASIPSVEKEMKLITARRWERAAGRVPDPVSVM